MANFLGVFAGLGVALQFKGDVGQSEPITQSDVHSELHAICPRPNAFFDNDMRIQRLFVFQDLHRCRWCTSSGPGTVRIAPKIA